MQKIRRQLYSKLVLNVNLYERDTYIKQPLIHVVGRSVFQLPQRPVSLADANCAHLYSLGGQGVVAKEIRWRKDYGRRESKGKEEEILKEWEVGGIGGKYATTNCF